jgi:hypothetical protein
VQTCRICKEIRSEFTIKLCERNHVIAVVKLGHSSSGVHYALNYKEIASLRMELLIAAEGDGV